MRRQIFATVEGVLRDFPRIVESLFSREAYLESIVHSSFNTVPKIGGDASGISLTIPERVLDKKINDVEYQELLGVVEVLNAAFDFLSPVSYKIISQVYFIDIMDAEIAAELDISESWVKKLRIRAVQRLSLSCLKILYVVERWRNKERKRQFDLMKLL